jgi:hypothetical protein
MQRCAHELTEIRLRTKTTLEAGLGSWLRPQENDNSADVAWTPITQNYLSSYCFYVLESGLKMWRDVIKAAFGTPPPTSGQRTRHRSLHQQCPASDSCCKNPMQRANILD